MVDYILPGVWTFILWTLPPRRTCSDLSSSGHVAATCRVGGMTLESANTAALRALHWQQPWRRAAIIFKVALRAMLLEHWNSCSLVAGGWRTLSGTEVYWRVTFCFGENGQFVLFVALWIWACTDDIYPVNVLDYFLDPSLQLNSSERIPSQLRLPKY